jgi:hypothetical protein
MEYMKGFHSIKVDPHQKGFGNLPDSCQQLLKASCQVAESATKKYIERFVEHMKDSHGAKAGPH